MTFGQLVTLIDQHIKANKPPAATGTGGAPAAPASPRGSVTDLIALSRMPRE